MTFTPPAAATRPSDRRPLRRRRCTTANAGHAGPPFLPPRNGPPPLHPPISLEGLPEAPADLAYVIVIEAGASDYSASPIAREEFPDLDATTRGTISIGRRLQDPLAELVKIDPQHIGVGLYQHDVKPKHLKESLEARDRVVRQRGGRRPEHGQRAALAACVGPEPAGGPRGWSTTANGTARSPAASSFSARARHRARSGTRRPPGFLKIPDSADPLDGTWIHPESYPLARQILGELGFSPDGSARQGAARRASGEARRAEPGRGRGETRNRRADAPRHPRCPRAARPRPARGSAAADLQEGRPQARRHHAGHGVARAPCLNVVPFGAFVDIGLKESGLVHISQMANRYIKSPYDVVAVGDVVTVWVMEVKTGEKKISLSMIPPGQERKQGGRFGGSPRGQAQDAAGPRPQPVPERPQGPRAASVPRSHVVGRGRAAADSIVALVVPGGAAQPPPLDRGRALQRVNRPKQRATTSAPETTNTRKAQAATEFDRGEEVGKGRAQHLRGARCLLQEGGTQTRASRRATQAAVRDCGRGIAAT